MISGSGRLRFVGTSRRGLGLLGSTLWGRRLWLGCGRQLLSATEAIKDPVPYGFRGSNPLHSIIRILYVIFIFPDSQYSMHECSCQKSRCFLRSMLRNATYP